MCLFNMFGFLLHLSAGAVEIVAARDAEANGAVVGCFENKIAFSHSLIPSFIFLILQSLHVILESLRCC